MSVPTAARDVIMARIREALRLPAPLPHGLAEQGPGSVATGSRGALDHGEAVPSAGTTHAAGLPKLPVLPADAARPWLPDGGDTDAERMALLLENLGKLRASVHRARDPAAARDYLFAMARERDWKRVAWHPHPLVEPLLAGVPCATQRVEADSFDKDALESCDAGFTACECLVAQTGSILVSSGTCGGRALSILPHVHVVVATPDQIVSTLADALHAVRARSSGRLPSMLSFITGPSRTGDIERILVLGAHGPKELLVLIVG